MENKNPSEVLCYDKFKLGRVEGKFSSDMKKLVIPAIPMMRGTAESYNEDTHMSGVIFVENEEATAKYKEYEKNRYEEKIAGKTKKTIDAKELINSVFDTLLKERIAEGKLNEPTLAEMKATCKEKGYPNKEWQQLSKADLTEYLKSKNV